MRRFGQVIKVRPEKLEYYRKLHANPWPGVNLMIKKCNIRNFSIYYKDGLLFSYFEYVGDNYEKDMEKMKADPETLRWWKETDPCQERSKRASRASGGRTWKNFTIWTERN